MPKAMPVPPPPKRPINFAPLMKPAPALAVWPPMPFRDAYRVGQKQGANWRTVATGFGTPDVWDLIWFNFRTTDPRQINWYLHRYVGCWQSNDGKNFSFRDAEPGIIFIPPFGWKRPTPDRLATQVVNMLAVAVRDFPYFVYKNVHINRAHFLNVSTAIRSGRIGLTYDPGLLDYHGAGAMYLYRSNRFILRDPFTNTLFNRSLLVHEAVHAIVDMAGGRYIQALDNEFIAFLSAGIATYLGGDTFRPLDNYGLAIDLADMVINASRTKSFVQVEEFDRVFEKEGEVFNPGLRLREGIKHEYINEWWMRDRLDGI